MYCRCIVDVLLLFLEINDDNDDDDKSVDYIQKSTAKQLNFLLLSRTKILFYI